MVDWYSILIKYGVEIPNEEQIVIHCPFHEDRKESCAINLDKGAWICFAGCGQGGLKSFLHKFSGRSWDEINAEIGGQIDSELTRSKVNLEMHTTWLISFKKKESFVQSSRLSMAMTVLTPFRMS